LQPTATVPYSVTLLAGYLKTISERKRKIGYHVLVLGQACKQRAFARPGCGG